MKADTRLGCRGKHIGETGVNVALRLVLNEFWEDEAQIRRQVMNDGSV